MTRLRHGDLSQNSGYAFSTEIFKHAVMQAESGKEGIFAAFDVPGLLVVPLSDAPPIRLQGHLHQLE